MQACQRICFFVEAVQINASLSGVQARIYFYAISLRSVNGNACGSKEASPIFYLKQVQHSVLKPPQSLRRKCPMAGKKKLSIADTTSFTGIEVHCRNQ